MGILSANLKHFYQRRGPQLAHAACVLLLFAMIPALLVEGGTRRGELAVLLIVISVLIGVVVGMMQLAVASKPFAFCLPGHRGAVRRLAFLIGVIASPVLGLPYLSYLEQPLAEPTMLVLVLFSGSCANLVAYLIGLAFALSMWNTAPMLNLTILGALTLAITLRERSAVIAQSILHRPDLMIVLGAAAAGVCWLWLGRPAWFRKRCARPWVGLLDAWDRSKMHKFRRVRTAHRFTKPPHPGIEAFFLGRIGSHGSADLRRCIWGTLYTTYALIAPQWKGAFLVVLLGVIWMGYVQQAALFIFIPMLGWIAAGFINPPLYSELPVAGSRRARSFATMGQVLAVAAAWGLAFGLAAMVVNRVMPLLPETEVAGLPVIFQPIDLNMLLLPVAVFPGVAIVRVLFYRNPMYLMLGTMLLLVPMMVALIMGRPAIPMSYVAAAAVLLWAICFLVIHEIAMRRDLVAR